LEHYLKLEDEMDKMIEGDPDQNTTPLGSFPTSSARRAQQAMFLARQVNETKKELKDLYGKLKQTEKDKAELEIEVDRLKDLNKQYVNAFYFGILVTYLAGSFQLLAKEHGNEFKRNFRFKKKSRKSSESNTRFGEFKHTIG
jgi:septal ring factor EnvC (AmiA/AmiB activator)